MINKINTFLKNIILFLPILIWILLPAYSMSSLLRIFVFASYLSIIIININKGSKLLLSKIIIFILLTSLIHYIFSDRTYLFRHLQLYIFILFSYLASIIITFPKDKKRSLLVTILIFNLITVIITIYNLLENSQVARIIAKTNEDSIELTSIGIGGYGVVYMNILLFPLYYIAYKNNKDSFFIKIIVIISFISTIFLVLIANYFIAILILIFQIALMYIIQFNFYKITLRLLLLIIFILIFFIEIDFFERITFKLVKNTNLQYKHHDIFIFLKNINVGGYGTLEGRSNRYYRSINYFLQNPLAGTLSFDNIGKHSNILDQFAQFGIILGILLLNIILYIPLKLLSFSNEKTKKNIIVFISSLMFLGLFNNYSMHTGITLIFLSTIIYSKKNE